MAPLPKVHLLAGLNGSGKTAFARDLEVSLPGVRFTLDEWMLRLYHLEFDHPDYPAAAARCRDLIWDTAVNVLRAGAPVILDWNLWSRARRAEWWNRACAIGAPCVLHYVSVPIDVAIGRATARVDPASHTLSAADIRHLAVLFEPPSATEGFALHEVSWPGTREFGRWIDTSGSGVDLRVYVLTSSGRAVLEGSFWSTRSEAADRAYHVHNKHERTSGGRCLMQLAGLSSGPSA